jgi:hypothetical protein
MAVTKIVLEDVDGNLLHEIEMEIGADLADIDSPDWPEIIIWNNRGFTRVGIPDCDPPHHVTMTFYEVTTLLLVAGGKDAMVKRLDKLAGTADAA